jgi:hypothetical protein
VPRPEPQTVAGVALATAPRPVLEYCERAVAALDREVPCPPLLPEDLDAGFADLLCSEFRRCFGRDAFALDLGFRGALDYRGLEDSEGKVTSYGHLLAWSYPSSTRADHVRCLGYRRPSGRARVEGVRVEWFKCPEVDGSQLERFPIDSGHVILEWRDGDYVNGISLHGHSRANGRLAVALASLIVGPEV